MCKSQDGRGSHPWGGTRTASCGVGRPSHSSIVWNWAPLTQHRVELAASLAAGSALAPLRTRLGPNLSLVHSSRKLLCRLTFKACSHAELWRVYDAHRIVNDERCSTVHGCTVHGGENKWKCTSEHLYRSVTVYAVWARTHIFVSENDRNVLQDTDTVFEDEVRVINERILERIASRMS